VYVYIHAHTHKGPCDEMSGAGEKRIEFDAIYLFIKRRKFDAIFGSLCLSMKKKGSANGARGAAEKRGMLKIPPATDEVTKQY
jgi:hypothetical protein